MIIKIDETIYTPNNYLRINRNTRYLLVLYFGLGTEISFVLLAKLDFTDLG